MKKQNQKKNLLLTDIFDSNMFEGGCVININKQLPTQSLLFQSNPITNSLYYTHYDSYKTIDELLVLTGDTEYNETISSAQFPLFFESQNSRYIPNKVKFAIEKYCSQPLLKDIHKDKEVAVELCLIFISNLSNAFYENQNGWKRLKAEILRDQVSSCKDNTYLKIIKFNLLKTKPY